MQSGEFLGRHHGPLMKVGLTLMKNVLMPFAKSVLVLIWLTAVAWAEKNTNYINRRNKRNNENS